MNHIDSETQFKNSINLPIFQMGGTALKKKAIFIKAYNFSRMILKAVFENIRIVFNLDLSLSHISILQIGKCGIISTTLIALGKVGMGPCGKRGVL